MQTVSYCKAKKYLVKKTGCILQPVFLLSRIYSVCYTRTATTPRQVEKGGVFHE